MTKTAVKPQAIPSVAAAEATVVQLQDKREKVLAERLRLENEMGQHSFAAHARGDIKAVAALDQIATSIARIDGHVREIDLAIATASRVLLGARQAVAAEQDRAAALKLREEVVKITEHMRIADEFFAAGVEALNAVNAGIEQIHKLGEPYPTPVQLKANIEYAIHTTLQTLPRLWWRDWLRPLAPLQRRSFVGIWAGMARRLEDIVRLRLGEAPLAEPESTPPPLAYNMEHDGGGGVEEALAAHRERMAERRERDIARSSAMFGGGK